MCHVGQLNTAALPYLIHHNTSRESLIRQFSTASGRRLAWMGRTVRAGDPFQRLQLVTHERPRWSIPGFHKKLNPSLTSVKLKQIKLLTWAYSYNNHS